MMQQNLFVLSFKVSRFSDVYPQEDSMKPMLETIISKVAQSLSGEARAFYDREFSFFNEVTSISGKLKPYIRKTKSEKKVIG